jgi:hypothetical protein
MGKVEKVGRVGKAGKGEVGRVVGGNSFCQQTTGVLPAEIQCFDAFTLCSVQPTEI